MTNSTKDTYSQFVRYAKFGFPFLAVLLFTGVFIFTKSNPIRDGLIISGPELAELAVGQKITNPHYSGVTKSGDAFTISAKSALPNAPTPDQVELIFPNTSIGFSDGLEVHASAEKGLLDFIAQEATLTGSVLLETSDAYRANATKVILNFYTGNAYSPNPVNATGPIGEINAGNMEITQDLHQKTSRKGTILSFGNGVKLVYYPSDTND